MPEGPLFDYRARVAGGALKPDPAQELLAEKLQSLHRALAGYTPTAGGAGWKERFGLARRREDAPLGLYIYGGVGGGKSMLMDLFYESVAVAHKRRVHFHEFLQDVHGRFGKFRAAKSAGDAGDPIPSVADQIAAEAWLLCFDELQVANIVDAMILGRLFEALFERGVVMVATSNRPPHDLYKDGLQREKFLPFIDLISEKLDILQLASGADYRLQRMRNMRVYCQPADDAAAAALTEYFAELTGGHAPVVENVEVKGRVHAVPAAGGVARMDFADLCQKPLGAADYLELAERYHTLILDCIPEMGDTEAAAARRFVTLIDALYENKVKLICSADAPPERLYVDGEGAFEFERLVSRLMEMQSVEYLALAHGRVE
ncbi:MAG: cell division protein ZapE [Rhodospirillaceae bacterium]|jgi:cell division protein ZapE|nr:cell division protein ZapE [Rhodospirillaceae bacterium]MBT3884385.1 cell division protein ZapE [Rhodospirillaceae bacterium]MBT4114920.1 cell division protein ZapE [Rhodospirillaceae bacterium]MBT4721496.1 cell division protein ZapE [Rhodospirillaceae bacterium]MBT4750648.1 cell division protein ZapE [Rhodospirillaceae bacterium]